jgi:hypothetical protein
MTKHSPCRALENEAAEAVIAITNMENRSLAARIRSLQRVDAIVASCIAALEAQRPAQPPTDPPEFDPVYI